MQRNLLRRGVALFNRGHFFDAHEVLEEVWRSLPRDSPSHRQLRLHVQGVVQLAVAFHHVSTGNLVGARSVLERAMRNLNGADTAFPDLDLERLRADMKPWREYLGDSRGSRETQEDRRPEAPHIPKITRRG
jgi:predicted metal-dependent hydrolase